MRSRPILVSTIAVGVLVLAAPRSASTGSVNPQRSFFAALGVGGGLNPNPSARSAANIVGAHPEAYSLGAFVISVGVGYRFNEHLGLMGGWNEAQHRAHTEWGKVARYTTGSLCLRIAFPLATRQTPVLKLGATVGRFAYGASSDFEAEDNDTLVVGPFAGIVLEHELLLGLVATLEIDYLPLYRKGMDGVLLLQEVTYRDDGTQVVDTIGSKDFTDDRVVHLLWFKVGLNFEWTIK